MMVFIMVIHGTLCILLACIILMQSGRGGGLTESFASAESIFGAQTNTLLVKGTTILAALFLFTCLSLAVMHSMKGKSLMSDRVAVPAKSQASLPVDSITTQAKDQAQKTDESVNKAVAEINKSVAEVDKIKPAAETAPAPAAQPAPAQ